MKKRAGRENESSAYRRGKKIREQVLGRQHLERATSVQTEFDADFQTFITETAWGSVWARPGLDLQTRHLITIGILAALGREQELRLHLSSIKNTDTSWHDVREVLMHVAVYAGIPAANSAIALAKEILGSDPKKGAAHA
jgi:4-carboxymuconolactone decarboxylase